MSSKMMLMANSLTHIRPLTCATAAATTALNSSRLVPQPPDLIKWVKTEGGFVHKSIKIAQGDSFGFGLVASENIPKGSDLIALPQHIPLKFGSSLEDEDSVDGSHSCLVKLAQHVPGIEKKEPTPLEKHVMFFDINKDGVIYPWETYKGFRKIGSGVLLSTAASLFINIGLSGKTRPGKWPSPLFPIEVKNIKFAKHGSDSNIYDSEGRFVPEKFEELFKKHGRTNANALTAMELDELLKANKQPKDFAGQIAAKSEWKILYLLCKDENGMLQKETIRSVYDGSLFEQMAKEKQSKKHRNKSSS